MKIFFKRKSLTMPKKQKGWTLWGFSTSILSQNIKKLKGGTLWETFFFRKKSLTMPKKLKGWTLWGFSTSILSQNIKQLKGGPFGKHFFPEKKSHNAEKTEWGTLWSRPVWYVTRENRKNLFGSVR